MVMKFAATILDTACTLLNNDDGDDVDDDACL